MIVFPREEPVVENLNSYYLNGSKLLEHYQGHLDSGAVHFKSAAAEGVIFFDKDGLLEGACEGRQEKLRGKGAVERLIHGTNEDNYTIGVYKVEGDEIYYWTSILGAHRVYEDLSAEFTDLEGLIRKMALEKLSGFIEISLSAPQEAGLIFFRNGLIPGGAYSREGGKLNRAPESREAFVREAKERGGVFHVSRITAARPGTEEGTPGIPQNILGALEELMAVLEMLMDRKKSGKGSFETLLRRKFIDLAETYPFLDPFAGEFTYRDRRIHFEGNADKNRFAQGLVSALKGLAEENGTEAEFAVAMEGWLKKRGKSLTTLGVKA